jgi:hypothetical protein
VVNNRVSVKLSGERELNALVLSSVARLEDMIEKRVNKHPLTDSSAPLKDLQYWLGRSPQERISAVQLLRRQQYGNRARLQRVARVTQLSQR